MFWVFQLYITLLILNVYNISFTNGNFIGVPRFGQMLVDVSTQILPNTEGCVYLDLNKCWRVCKHKFGQRVCIPRLRLVRNPIPSTCKNYFYSNYFNIYFSTK